MLCFLEKMSAFHDAFQQLTTKQYPAVSSMQINANIINLIAINIKSSVLGVVWQTQSHTSEEY